MYWHTRIKHAQSTSRVRMLQLCWIRKGGISFLLVLETVKSVDRVLGTELLQMVLVHVFNPEHF